MDSCQPEQSIEPGYESCKSDMDTSLEINGISNGVFRGDESFQATIASSAKKRKLFVPIFETNKKRKCKENMLKSLDAISTALSDFCRKFLIAMGWNGR